MEAKILRSESEHEAALNRMLQLGDPEPGTPEGEEFELLLLLIEDYERKHVEPIPDPHPVAVIKHMMEERNLKRADFGRLINSRSHATEILNLQRPLSLKHIRLLSTHWNIPAEVLIQEYKLGSTQKKRKSPSPT